MGDSTKRAKKLLSEVCVKFGYTERDCADTPLGIIASWIHQHVMEDGLDKDGTREKQFDFKLGVLLSENLTMEDLKVRLRGLIRRYCKNAPAELPEGAGDLVAVIDKHLYGLPTPWKHQLGIKDADGNFRLVDIKDHPGGTIFPPGGELDLGEPSLRELQTNLPWTVRYSQDFRSNPQSHKDFAHALVHVTKALGILSAFVDDMDHDRAVADDSTLRDKYGKYVADLVVCALRAANTFPGGVLDLQKAVVDRIESKNGVKL